MEQVPGLVQVADVAAFTAKAAHGRDHEHPTGERGCHPHVVEVVYLGQRALAVCHDCRADSGFVPFREAERLAKRHRNRTLEVSVLLTGAEEV